MNRRLILAAIAAPLVTLAAVDIVGTCLVILTGHPRAEALSAAGVVLGLLAMFGVPVAYAVEALVGFPTYAMMRRGVGVRPFPVIAVAAVASAIVLPLVWYDFWGPPIASWLVALAGLIPGAVGGAVFWQLAWRGASPAAAPAAAPAGSYAERAAAETAPRR